jgi:hypothetical protein
MNQSETDLGIVNESQLLRFGIRDRAKIPLPHNHNICTDPQYGFREYHATTMDNPMLPKLLVGETLEAWKERRRQFIADLKKDNDPLVYQQEYLAEFVDWAGVAFFAREKLLDQGQPFPYPKHCDCVFAVIDTASKTGTEHDATAVTFFAKNTFGAFPLLILDWEITQIEGAIVGDLATRCVPATGRIGPPVRGPIRSAWRYD